MESNNHESISKNEELLGSSNSDSEDESIIQQMQNLSTILATSIKMKQDKRSKRRKSFEVYKMKQLKLIEDEKAR